VLVSTEAVSTDAGFREGKIVGEIVNYDGDPYGPLQIQPGVSCLWLRGDPGMNTGWQAAVLPETSGRGCRFTTALNASTIFSVTRLAHGGAVYPSTGRWMWDATNQKQGIGVRCGRAWCEFGDGTYVGTREILNVESVPGWFDEQRLSYVPTNGGALQLSDVVGRITPRPGLHQTNPGEFKKRKGALIATVTFKGPEGPAMEQYRRKYSLTPNATSSQLMLRAYKPWLILKTKRQFKGESGGWRELVHNPHALHAGRGAVRWSWSDDDEKAWFPCPVGCCETDQGNEI
jgi:hypothetical protein